MTHAAVVLFAQIQAAQACRETQTGYITRTTSTLPDGRRVRINARRSPRCVVHVHVGGQPLLIDGARSEAAYRQCFEPAFAQSIECFSHDMLTGEDL